MAEDNVVPLTKNGLMKAAEKFTWATGYIIIAFDKDHDQVVMEPGPVPPFALKAYLQGIIDDLE